MHTLEATLWCAPAWSRNNLKLNIYIYGIAYTDDSKQKSSNEKFQDDNCVAGLVSNCSRLKQDNTIFQERKYCKSWQNKEFGEVSQNMHRISKASCSGKHRPHIVFKILKILQWEESTDICMKACDTRWQGGADT